MISKKLPASVKIFQTDNVVGVAKMQMKEFKAIAGWLETVIFNILNYFCIYMLHIYIYRGSW
jgi:hypothetical protein